MSVLRPIVSFVLCIQLIFTPSIFTAVIAAEIQVDGTTQTTITKARNGVKVVNIAKPNSKGLSHNKYLKYNVGKKGLILNNSGKDGVKTRLGGYIHGNNHLGNQNAKVILNEVTGHGRSHLKGYTEIAGKKADLILINPNGISLNGAGFINTPNVTFSTGKGNIIDGVLKSFRVERGDVTVEGKGLDTSAQRSTRIFSRYLKLNAKIFAKDLNISSGRAEVDADTGQHRIQASDESQEKNKKEAKAQQVALDSSALGGMYANRITLIGTEKGVGVNLPPEVVASEGDIRITADGKIVLNQLSAKNSIQVASRSDRVKLRKMAWGKTVQMEAKEELEVATDALLVSAGEARLNTKKLKNRGRVNAGYKRGGTSNANGNLHIKADEIDNRRGTLTSSGSAVLNSSGFNNTEGAVQAADLNIETKTQQLKNSKVIASNTLGFKTDNLEIEKDTLIQSAGDLTVQTGNSLNNRGTLIAGKNLNIETGGELENNATLRSGEDLLVKTHTSLTNNGSLSADKNLKLESGGVLKNSADIQSGEGLSVISKTGISNRGNLLSGQNLRIETDGALKNSATLHSHADLYIKTKSGLNNKSSLVSSGNLQIETEAGLENSSTLNSGGDLSIRTKNGLTNRGSLVSSKNLKIETEGDVENTVTLHAGADLSIKAKTRLTNSGSMVSGNNLKIETDGGVENNSALNSGADLSIKSKSDINNRNSLVSGENLKIETEGTLRNTGKLYSGSDASVNAKSGVINSNSLGAAKNLGVETEGNLENSAKLYSGLELMLKSRNLRNSKTIFSGGKMDLLTRDTLSNQRNANILSLGDMTLAKDKSGGKTSRIVNFSASIEIMDGDMTVRAGTLDNTTDSPHKASSTGPTTHYVKDKTHKNSYKDVFTTVTTERFTSKPKAAKMVSGKNMTIIADTLNNRYSMVAANQNLNVHAGHTNNQSAIAQRTTRQRIEHYKNKQKKRRFRSPKDKKKHVGTYHDTKVATVDSVSATIQGGQNVTVSGDGGITNSDRPEGETPTINARTKDLETYDKNPDSTGDSLKRLQKIKLPEGTHGLFITSGSPTSRYLIETNPEFTIYKNFISSDYMMKNLAIDPEKSARRVGDDFYENRLIRDSIFKQTGKRFLKKDLKTDHDQYKYLMDNGLKAAQDLNLAYGVSLTKKQADALTADMVWMEEQVIGGDKVLVPVVYIANPDHLKVTNGAHIIAGKDLDMKVKTVLNSGTLKAGENLRIEADRTITNYGGTVKADKDVMLVARGDIKNQGGAIEADHITVRSEQGRFIHETLAESTDHSASDYSDKKTKMSDTATLQANGKLSIHTAKETVIKGASVKADQMDVKADSLTVTTILNNRETGGKYSDEGDYVKASSTTHIGSQIRTGDLNIITNGKTTIEGSGVQADRRLKIDAGEIDVKSVSNTAFKAEKKSSKDLISSKLEASQSFKSKVQGADLNAGQIELTTRKGDVNIIGSNLKAEKTLSIDSANHIQIKSAHDGSFSEKKKSSSGLFKSNSLYATKEALEGKMKKTAVASNVSAGNLELKSKNDLLVKGSSVEGDQIKAESRNIYVVADHNEEKDWSKKTETKYNFSNMVTDLDKVVSFEDKKVLIKLADASYEKGNTGTTKKTASSSSVNGGRITLTARSDQEDQGNIKITGSHLNAREDITLTASNDVSIKEATDTNESKKKKTSGKADVRVGVKHQAGEMINAIEALQAAQTALRKAKRNYKEYKKNLKKAEKNYKEGLIEKEDLADLRADERFYHANIAVSAAAVANATRNLTQQTIATTQSGKTWGFNAEGVLDLEATVEKMKSDSSRAVASSLTANNITVKAGNKALVQGSHLEAEEKINLNAKEVEITASQDRSTSQRSENTGNLKISYAAYGGLSASSSLSMNNSQSKDVTYNNASLKANNISITSEDDTDITGAGLRADEKLKIKTGGNLKVASLQGRSKSKTHTVGVDIGIGRGSATVGASASHSRTNKKWVNEVTRLTGNEVEIEVDNHTDLKGAVIAATDKTGEDTGKLNLKTQSLRTRDIKDIDRTESTNLSIAYNGSKDKDGKTTSDVGYQDGGYGFTDKRQVNRATIGKGTITVGDQTNPDLDVNRDIKTVQVEIKDTGAHLQVDKGTLEVMTDTGKVVTQIKDDSQQIALLAKKGIEAAGIANEEDVSLKQTADAIALEFDTVNTTAELARGKSKLKEDIKTTEDQNAAQAEKTVNAYFQYMQENNLVIDPKTMQLVTIDKNSPKHLQKYRAATNLKSLKSYLNIHAPADFNEYGKGTTDITNGGEITAAVVGEMVRQHFAREAAKSGKAGNYSFETKLQKSAASGAEEVWNTFSGEETSKISHKDWLTQNQGSKTIAKGNADFRSEDPYMMVPYSREAVKGVTYMKNGYGDMVRRGEKQMSKGHAIPGLVNYTAGMVGYNVFAAVDMLFVPHNNDETNFLATMESASPRVGLVGIAAMPFVKGGKLFKKVVNSKAFKNTTKTLLTRKVKTNSIKSVSNFEIKDGMKVSTDNALDMAEKYLGTEYKDVGKGRFISKDGTRVVRMGDSDILGKHGGGPHMNFESLGPNPDKPGKMRVIENKHIYLKD